jgi:hypothetical protein
MHYFVFPLFLLRTLIRLLCVAGLPFFVSLYDFTGVILLQTLLLF